MKRLWVVYALASFLCLSLSVNAEQKDKGENLFRKAVVQRLITYIKVSKVLEKEAHRLADKAGYKTENIGVHGTISDMAYRNDWCEYQNLTAREKHEVFKLRLTNFPTLRDHAKKVLRRDVAKDGFGWHLLGEWVNDYSYTEKGARLGQKFFNQTLARRGLTSCVAR